MIISKEKLRLYYWLHTKSGSGPCNLPEIEKGEHGYDLQPGQEVFALRYYLTNLECFFICEIHEVTNEGIFISSFNPEKKGLFVPWVKDFPVPAPNGHITKCTLYVEPCEALYEKNKLADILSGNIPDETWEYGKLMKDRGRGIWYQHGGWRTTSRFERNLKYFVKLGQQVMI